MLISQSYAQKIADEMKEAIGRNINIMDRQGVILASTDPDRKGQLHQGAVRLLREGLTSLSIEQGDPGQGVQAGVNFPVTAGGQVEGVIGITGPLAEVSSFARIVQRMAELLIQNAQRQQQAELQDKARALFIESWLFSDQPDWTGLEFRGQLLGMDIREPYTVAVLTLAEREASHSRPDAPGKFRRDAAAQMIRGRLREDGGHACAVMRECILLLLHNVSRWQAQELTGSICQDIEGFFQVLIAGGISGPIRSPNEVRSCFHAARTAAEVAARFPGKRVLFYDKTSLEFVLRSIPREIRSQLNASIFSGCTAEEYRAFIQLIQDYFAEGGNLRRCAEKRFVHRNTIQYHIERLKRQTGYDLRVPGDAVLLCLAVQPQ